MMLNKDSQERIKPVVEIIGVLCYELKAGFRAFVNETSGKGIMTSQVVDVRNETADGVEFETLNTIYKLTYATVQATV